MGLVPNGLLPDASDGVTRRLDPERWAVLEGRTAELIASIQPNVHSEVRRQAVYHYVQRLIMNCVPCQVFTYGSVPLKTYLPDGDIDVSAFSNSKELKEIWANLVRDALELEEKSENAEFLVQEVQYIQAEVKIIKCLVENIAVDISFNQVGGLCTLCFLEEVDSLISQNHLFKRSIILIKAWCYYESRILGAHHGLISTYALETLVLYIFHIFNNSFTGPLEVLYRFLEFFSNFDWEKFCLSLWGPVPISSLPDMNAEPPRMDSGELLLSKSFLNNCSSAYGVMPCSQEIQGQQFVSKHFNVIDPLRTNNNLGRSVSKGNLFRIRSAFAYGAKRLAKLLECPKEDLIAELNQFFRNTWLRYGSGNRPDVPTTNLIDMRPLKVIPIVAPNSQRNVTAFKEKVENPKLCANQDHSRTKKGNRTEVGHSYPDPSKALQRSDLHNHNLQSTGNPSVSHAQHQRNYAMQGKDKVSEQLETNNSAGLMQSERDNRAPNGLIDRNGQSRSRFARTRSSPELTDSSDEGFQDSGTSVVDMEKPVRVDSSHRKNIFVPEVSSNHSTKSSNDVSMSTFNSSSRQSAKEASVSNCVASSYHEDNGFVTTEELPSISESSDMHHNEQVLVNLVASTKLHGTNGQIQLPMQIPAHLSVAHSHLLAPTAFSQKHLAGIPPASLVGAPWLPHMQFVHGLVPPPMAHYIHSPTSAPNSEDGSESDKPMSSDAKHDTVKTWHEYGVGFSGHCDPEARDPCIYDIDGKEHSSIHNGVSGASLEKQMESTVEDDGVDDSAPFVFPFVPGNSDGSCPQIERTEGIDQLTANIAGQNFSSPGIHQPDSSGTSAAPCSNMAGPSGEPKPDILNSDFISHWNNLQYGRLCQNAHPLGPVIYPFVVPQTYLQGHAPWNGPGRPAPPNFNWTQMVGPGQRVFPVNVMPPQPATERGTGVLQLYGEDAPRYRGGTGTYFPNPVPFRDRHSSSRIFRGGYNSDRGDHNDKEGSWINSKQRNANRNYGRSQSERSDRQAFDESQSDRHRRTYRNDSYRHEPGTQYLVQGQSTSSMRKQGNMSRGIYAPPTASNSVDPLSGPPGPPFVMVHPYEPGANHGSSSEPIEFGSLGPLPTANGDDVPRPTSQVMPNGFYGQKRGPYRGGSSHSSPDQPSSPQPRR